MSLRCFPGLQGADPMLGRTTDFSQSLLPLPSFPHQTGSALGQHQAPWALMLTGTWNKVPSCLAAHLTNPSLLLTCFLPPQYLGKHPGKQSPWLDESIRGNTAEEMAALTKTLLCWQKSSDSCTLSPLTMMFISSYYVLICCHHWRDLHQRCFTWNWPVSFPGAFTPT